MIINVKINHTPTQRVYKPTEYVEYGILKVLEAWKNVPDVIKIRLCGVALVLIGISLCVVFPEDATGGLLACFMGLLVALFYNGIETE